MQRKALAESCNDFSASLHALALVELSPSLSAPLEGLSDIQTRIRDLYDRQAQQDVLTLGIVIDEYIRLIGSIKQAFQQRQKAYHSWHSSESALSKLKSTQDKLLRAGRTQQDRLSQMQADVGDAERRVHQSRLLFEDMGRLMRSELERFEREKVEDFKSGVETYLESAVEAQKEVSKTLQSSEFPWTQIVSVANRLPKANNIPPQLIELWETYLMQLDAEDDGGASGGVPTAGISASPEIPAESTDETATRPSEDTAVQHETATAEGSLGSADDDGEQQAPKIADDQDEEDEDEEA